MELCKLLRGLVNKLRLSSSVSSLDCGLSSSGSSSRLVIHLASASCGPSDFGSWSWGITQFVCTRLHLELRLLESFTGVTIDGVVCVMSSCGMSSRRTSPELCSTVKALTAALSGVSQPASPQVLLLLKLSLTYHGAWRLRLVEGCLLFFSFPIAARGCLLPPLSFSRLHTVCVWALVLCPQSFSSPHAACGWDAVVLESVCLLLRARHSRRNPAGTTHVVRPCFYGLQALLRAVEVSWFMTSISSRLSRVACARQRLLTPAAVAASAWSVGTTRRIQHFAD